MMDPQLVSQVEAASAYDGLLVPALFGRWAPIVADHAGLKRGDRVLDVACGTGALARHVKSRIGVGGFVAGVDPNPGMLAVASERAPDLEWRQGVAESLPYATGVFDAVVSQFGLMFFSDPDRAVREMLRVVKPGGRVTVAVWASLDSNAAYAAEVDLLERTAGLNAANVLRAPFVLGDAQALADLFKGSGAASVEVHELSASAEFPSIRTMVEADLRGWLPLFGIMLAEEEISRILDEAEVVFRSYVAEAGTFRFPTHALVATCSTPS